MVRSMAPRPVMPAPVRAEVPTPQQPPPPPADEGGSATATVAIPGVRRVTVGPAGALPAGAEAAPVAAATVAGAMGAAATPSGDATPDGEAPAEREARPGAPTDDAPSASTDGGPSAAVPLSSSPVATAEPLGAAQALAGAGFAPEVHAGDPASDTAENTVVRFDADSAAVAQLDPQSGAEQAFEPGAGVVARPAPPPEDVPSFDPAPGLMAALDSPDAVEISAERIQPPAFDVAAGGTAAPAASPWDAVEQTSPAPWELADEGEPPPLGPSTAAGARPRFPAAPAAPDARATPVGVTARGRAAPGTAGTAGTAGAAGDAGDAATMRRGRLGEEEGDAEIPRRGGGPALRLLAAAVVIVAVLIFIATKVFAPAAKSGPSTGTSSTVGGPSPAKIIVAVLNGTHTSGLAGRASAALSGLGLTKGAVANALSHGHTVTLVGYTPGNRAAALEVKKDLAPTATRVGPVDPRTLAVAETQGGTVPTVVVTLGSNYTPR